MSKTVVISQPMLFPWVGLLEQIRLADVFVHYDDVQYVVRGFTNRVQIKTSRGTPWMTIPLERVHRGQLINEVIISKSEDWRESHRGMLKQAYGRAPYYDEMMSLVEDVYSTSDASLCNLLIRAIESVGSYFGIAAGKKFLRSSELPVKGRSTARLLGIVQALEADVYVTGHGAKNYLDHALFENSGIRVEYMSYSRAPYPQLHGGFDPHVSCLDLIANLGRAGAKMICSETVPWQQFLKETCT